MKVRTILSIAGPLLLSAAAVQAQTDNSTNTIEEVVITGSRVIANGNDSPTPLTVISTEELSVVRPGNLVEALNDIPAISGSRTQNSNNGTGGAAGSPATSQNAGNVINLRQMGLLRTLVLYDGHRAPPSTPDGYVDLDTIPQMLLQRVDIVTGGVSAVYGSDGISGVVNLVTDTGFEGVKAHVQSGQSTYGDANTAEAGLAFGTSVLDGRGHFMGSYETRSQDAIDSKLDRPWAEDIISVQGSGTEAFPYIMLKGVRQNNQTFGGRVNGNASRAILGDTRFADGGFLVPFVHGSTEGISVAVREIGGDGGHTAQQIRAGLEMNQLYGRFDYDFADNLTGYVSVSHTRNNSTSTGGYNGETNLTVSRDNAYLRQTYRDQLAAAGASTFSFGKFFREMPRGGLETDATQTFVNAGLQGSLGEYDWEVAAVTSKGSFKVTDDTARDNGRYYASIDSVVSGGVPVCRAALTNPLYANCVPMNLFGENSVSQEAIDYFMTSLDWTTNLGMQNLSASFVGAPFSTWAGPVNAAVSTEWRKVTYEIDSNTPGTEARADCTGILFNCNANTRRYSSAVDSVSEVSTTVSEAAVEFAIPLLDATASVGALDLTTAYRVANYEHAGTANTWKLGLTWDPLETLTFRATRSRDFRAPSLDEAFRSQQVNFTGFNDWISGDPLPQNNIPTEVGGNPDLKPEFGDTLTYGVVWRPTDNFDIAVDAYNITVSDAIFLVQGNNPNVQNVCYDAVTAGGTSAYCQLIGRGLGIYDRNDPQAQSPANAVNLWRQTFINLAEIEVEGIDIESSFRTSIADRPLTLRVLATHQPHVYYRLPEAPVIDYAGSAFGTNARQASPVWRATAFASLQATDNLSVALQARWRSELDRTPDDDVEGTPPVKAVTFFNLNIGYRPDWNRGDVTLFLNVQNLFNTDPPAAGNYLNPTPGNFGEYVQGDDPIGRYYTAGVRIRM